MADTRLVSGSAKLLARWRVPGWALGIAVVLMSLAALVTVHLPPDDGNRHPGPLAAAIVAIGVLGAAVTLRFPLPGALLVAAALGAYVGRSYPSGPIYAVGLVAMFFLGRRTGRLTIVAGLAAIVVAMVAGWAVSDRSGALVAFYPGWAAGAAAIGAALRNRRRYLHEQAARAASVERTRAEEALRLLAEDRLRIARDLHDGVAHAMATINVQAAAAARVVDRQPAAAKDALSAIARASGTVLDELTAIVTLLREPGEPAALAPTPGLDDVPALLASVREAGVHCELATTGDLGLVGPPLATAAYRVVQESLTNVLKHANAGRVRVELHQGDDGFRVAVTDDGAAVPDVVAGNGIRGMRERVETTGGEFSAGASGGGFAVRAEWPAPR